MDLIALTGGVNALGSMKQHCNGKICTKDFGKNIHFKHEHDNHDKAFHYIEKLLAIKEFECKLLAKTMRFVIKKIAKKEKIRMTKMANVMCKIRPVGPSLAIAGNKLKKNYYMEIFL